MTEDKEVIEAIWNGSVPACFKLASHECNSLQNPEPFFMMLPRISYFPLLWEKIQRHFVRFVAEENRSSPIWLDFNQVPLRWQYPIGVLFDLMAKDVVLPWTITVHFNDFPEKEVIPCPNRQVAEVQFMNSVKEADFLKTRKKVMNTMTQSERRSMATALFSLTTESFWTVNRKLMFTGEPWKHVPLRIFLSETCRQLQRLIGIANAENEPVTLRDVVSDWVKNFSEDTHDAILHGVPAPLDAPLQWLSINMSYADNFLYVVVKPK